jgi:hypothetical protein
MEKTRHQSFNGRRNPEVGTAVVRDGDEIKGGGGFLRFRNCVEADHER